MSEQRKNLLTGLFVVVALCLMTGLILFLRPSIGDGRQELRVRFVNIDKVSIGTRVTLAGQPIGYVSAIEPIKDARLHAATSNERVYFYEVTLKVDSTAQVYAGDQISIQTSGLLGERCIAIAPKALANIQESPAKGIILYGKSNYSVEDTFAELAQVASHVEDVVSGVSRLLESNATNLNKAIEGVANASTSLEHVLAQVNNTSLIGDVNKAATAFASALSSAQKTFDVLASKEVAASLAGTLHHLEKISNALDNQEHWQQLLGESAQLAAGLNALQRQLNNRWPSFDKALQDFSAASQSFRAICSKTENAADGIEQIVAKVKKGEGTLGQLVASEGIYLETMGLFNKANILLDDINHYGLLFHLSREWRQNRSDRASAILQLKKPEAFRQYFEEELGKINICLSHIESLIKKADQEKRPVSKLFSKEYADLLRRVDVLQQELNLFRQTWSAGDTP